MYQLSRIVTLHTRRIVQYIYAAEFIGAFAKPPEPPGLAVEVLGLVMTVRSTIESAPVLDWPPIPPRMLMTASTPRMHALTRWLASTPNSHREGGVGGASSFLVPIVHHALRRNGVALPRGVMLATSMGGRIVEEAWRRIAHDADLEQQWTDTCAMAVVAVGSYIRTSGLHVLQSRLVGESEWPALPDSEDPNTDPVREAVQVDDTDERE